MKSLLKSVGYIGFYILIQMLLMSAVSMGIGLLGGNHEHIEIFMSQNVMLLVMFSNLLTMFLLVGFANLRHKNLTEELQLRKIKVQECFLPCMISFAYSMFFALATYDLDFENATMIQSSVSYYSGLIPNLGVLLQIIALLIIAPMSEELLCRGFILSALQKEHGFVFSVVSSALLFGFLHIMAGGSILILGSLIMGIILGVICGKTKALWIAVVAHVFANIPDFIIAALPQLPDLLRYSLLMLFGLLFVVSILKFAKDLKNTN